MELDHKRFHIIKLKVSLFLGACVDGGQDGGVIKIDITILTVLFMSGNAGHSPFTSSDIALMFGHSRFGLARRFSYTSVLRFIFAVTIKFVYDLTWREFCLVFSAYDILKADSWREDYSKACFVKDST